MPTNYLRSRNTAVRAAPVREGEAARRLVEIAVGRTKVRAELLDTPTANRIWAALPLFATAETWGDSVHFEIPIPSGRERNARMLAEAGYIYFWSHEERILIPFGSTPISRDGEIRLPAPCNVLARCIDGTTVLKCVTPGEKVVIKAATNG